MCGKGMVMGEVNVWRVSGRYNSLARGTVVVLRRLTRGSEESLDADGKCDCGRPLPTRDGPPGPTVWCPYLGRHHPLSPSGPPARPDRLLGKVCPALTVRWSVNPCSPIGGASSQARAAERIRLSAWYTMASSPDRVARGIVRHCPPGNELWYDCS